jgi:glucose-1-phosphate adenylyltransferase
MAKDLVIILAGGAGKRLLLLSRHRAKPAVPFGGIYRIIDFALSNCVNSGLRQIFILSQYEPRSLWRHLDFGNPWDLNTMGSEVVILQPYIGNVEDRWYEGNADAVRRNMHFIEERTPDAVLILAGDHVYKMDYRPLLEFHKQRKADLTVAVTRVKPEETPKLGTCVLDGQKRIVEFYEKSKEAKSTLASMGIYVFSRKALRECLRGEDTGMDTAHDFGGDILPVLVEQKRAYGYEFRGYWRDVGTVGTYFETSMDLLGRQPAVVLSDPDWPILTNFEDLPPASFSDGCRVSDSLVCHGAVIRGTVESSVVSPGVTVERDAVVRNSVVFADSVVGEGALVNLSIIDKEVVVGERAKLGYGVDFCPNNEHPALMNTGLTLVEKGSIIPAGSVIGRNCQVLRRDRGREPVKVESGHNLA